jgi:hypothetical protein
VFLVDEGGPREHFNFTKFHSILHYPAAIPQIGSLDGVTSEYSERQHIDVAKDAYDAVRKTDYIRFMTVWLDRQVAMQRHERYVSWVQQRSLFTSEDNLDADTELGDTADDGDIPDSVTLSAGSRQYFIAKRPNMTPKAKLHPRELERNFSLFAFSDTVKAFLKDRSKLRLTEVLLFSCWTRFRIHHAKIYDFGDSKGNDQICAMPPPPRSTKHLDPRAPKEGTFHTVLSLVDSSKPFPHCESSIGLSVHV